MNQKRIILNLLLSNERVDITAKNYFSLIRRYLFTLFLLNVILNYVYLYFNDINFISLGLAFGNFVLFSVMLRKLLKNTSTTSIKGDTLILNNSKNRSCVTTLRSIKQIKSTSFLHIQITRLYYNIDGRNRKTIIFTFKNARSFSPANMLKRAIEISKKQKANHKPGPVAA